MRKQPHAVRPWPASTRGNTALTESPKGHSAVSIEHGLTMRKRGRQVLIAKLVVARPLGELVLAMPYRNRQPVDVVSLPPAVLAHARRCGARFWAVRFDALGTCHALPLAEIERLGWLKASDDKPEWFLPLTAFRAVPWQTWNYVTDEIDLTAVPALPPAAARLPDGRQPSLFDVDGAA